MKQGGGAGPNRPKKQKNHHFFHFFSIFSCQFKNYLYLCNRNSTFAPHVDSVAQLVEQLTLNQWVEGSSPSGVTKIG